MLHQPTLSRPHPSGPWRGIAPESSLSLAPSILPLCKVLFRVCKLAVISPAVSRKDNPPSAGSTLPSFCSRATCKRYWCAGYSPTLFKLPHGPPTSNAAILRVTVTPTSLDPGPCLMVLPSLASRTLLVPLLFTSHIPQQIPCLQNLPGVSCFPNLSCTHGGS